MKQKDAIQIGITGVLVLILLMTMVRACNKVKKRKKLSSPPAASAVQPQSGTTAASAEHQPGAQPVPVMSSEPLYVRFQKETEGLELIRDPFSKQAITPTAVKGKVSSLQLNGIAWDEERPTAIINNEIAEVGSQIDEYTVVEIRKDRVILSDGEQNLVLTIGL